VQHSLQAAFGHSHAGEVGDGLDRFMEGVLHGRPDQSPLQLIGKRAGGQNQCLVERIDAGCARPGVAHANNLYRAKDGFQGAGAEATMGVPGCAILLLHTQGGAHISLAAVFEVGLKQQTLHLTASVLLPALNLVEGELQGRAGRQPGFQPGEFVSGWGEGICLCDPQLASRAARQGREGRYECC
jgi:hypothetical protein